MGPLVMNACCPNAAWKDTGTGICGSSTACCTDWVLLLAGTALLQREPPPPEGLG